MRRHVSTSGGAGGTSAPMAGGFQTRGFAAIEVIGGNRPSIISRDLMAELRLQLVQRAPREPVMEIHEEQTEGENNLDQWQDYLSKQFTQLFTRVVKNRH